LNAGQTVFATGMGAVRIVLEPDGYRMRDYQAPVPDTLGGARVVSADEVRLLGEQGGAVLVDVLPAPRRPDGLRPQDLWLPAPHRNLPGSMWLPGVGYGVLSDDLDAYFRLNLEHATCGDKSRTLVIYCRADCWMSWNAAKRAVSYGYSSVNWFPQGIEGWSDAGYPLQESTPAERYSRQGEPK
jgi:PQQ-dependent catabolism-associated CXXCW motif protein